MMHYCERMNQFFSQRYNFVGPSAVDMKPHDES